jgi:hypothetical protein
MPDHEPSWNTRARPTRGRDRILVEERDAQTSDLPASGAGGVPLVAPGDQPAQNGWPKQEGPLAAGQHRLSDGHARATFDRLEAHVDLRVVHEAAIGELEARLPDCDPAVAAAMGHGPSAAWPCSTRSTNG